MSSPSNFRAWIILAIGIPLLFIHASWGVPAFIAFVLTAGVFGIALAGEYPTFGTTWFWKTMPTIVACHFGIVSSLVALDFQLPGIHSLPRIMFGFIAIILVLEWKAALWLLNFFRPCNEDQ